jgi:predicted cupin superfamily sugar epimerase
VSRPTTAAEWIVALDLEVLDGESGRFAVVHGHEASSSIYYLLDAELPVNLWHWLASDDVHVLVDGGPVEYVIVPPSGPARRHVLGLDVAAGQVPVVPVPADSYKGLRLLDPADYALMVTVVAPPWTPERVRIETPPADVVARARDGAPWLTDELVELLGRSPG